MRYIITVCLTLLIVWLAATGWAQDSSITCTKYRLLLKKGIHEVGTEGVLKGGEFTGLATDGNRSNYPVSEILKLDRLAGNNGGKGALIGGAIGAVTVMSAIIQVETDPNMDLREERVLPITAAFVGGGALIGYLVGASSERWEHVPLKKVVGMKLDHGLGLQFTVFF